MHRTSRTSSPSGTTRLCLLALAGLASLSLVACDSKPAPGALPTTPKAATSTAAAADKLSDGLPTPRCNDKAAAGLPGPDIAGLKLGMAREDALNAARCLNKDAFVSFEAQWLQGLRTNGVQMAPQAFSTQVGEHRPCKFNSMDEMNRCGAGNRVWTHVAEKVTVATPGVPGREKVVGIWREQHFKPGDMPTADTLVPALTKKYGPPQATQAQTGQWMRLEWLQDASGTPVTPGSRGYNLCRGIQARGQDSQSWNEACGTTVVAMIVLSPANPLLARELNVGLVHQQALYSLGRQLQADLQALGQQRQQQEAQQNQSAASKVKL